MFLLKTLLIFHTLGDYYFQSNKLSKLKNDNFLFVVLHSLLYTILFVPIVWISTNKLMVLVMLAIIFTSHLFFDCFMSKFSKADKNLKLLLIDQFLHITIIIVVWFCLRSTTVEIMDINNFLDQIEILVSFEKIISIILIFLLIGRPTSIFIEKLLPIETKKEDNLSCEQKENKKCNEEFENFEQIQKNNFNYGSFIGILERITIVLLAILNLWSSIALVFTAKSIARFKQLEDKNFAQKYLIGTLLSLSITLFFLLVFL